MITEAETRLMLAGQRAEALVACIEKALERYRKESVVRPARTRAGVLWDYMTDEADERFATLEGIERVVKHGSKLYVVDDRIVVRFKKHNRDYETRNYKTKIQKFIARTGIFDDMPEREVVTCGYIFDAAEAQFERLVVVRHVHGGREGWDIDLRELAAGVVEPVKSIITGYAAAAAPLPGIAPAKKEEEGDRT